MDEPLKPLRRKTPPRPIQLREYEAFSAYMEQEWKPKINGNLWGAMGRLVTWTLQILVLAAIVWARSNFVAREEYARDTKETLQTIIIIGKDMQRITDKLDGYQEIIRRNEALESRVRELEKQTWRQNHPNQ